MLLTVKGDPYLYLPLPLVVNKVGTKSPVINGGELIPVKVAIISPLITILKLFLGQFIGAPFHLHL